MDNLSEPSLIIGGEVFTASNFTPPDDMVFGEAQVISIITYAVLFVFGLTFNTISLYKLVSDRVKIKVRSKMNLLLIHLAIADLVVILFQVPLEMGWTYTVSWRADDLTCRVMVFVRIVGFYLSGFVMMVISIDRLMAIMHPVTHRIQRRRTRVMLGLAWVLAPLCSLPQSFLFKLRRHPLQPDYAQCTTIGSFTSEEMEFLYFVFVFSLTWLVPLLVMLACYIAIILLIYRRSRRFGTTNETEDVFGNRISGVIGKAKIKTVKITGILVLGFVLCWTPYNLMYVWHFFHKESATKTDFRIQKWLYTFACANNCLNPLLYRMVGRGWCAKSVDNSDLSGKNSDLKLKIININPNIHNEYSDEPRPLFDRKQEDNEIPVIEELINLLSMTEEEKNNKGGCDQLNTDKNAREC